VGRQKTQKGHYIELPEDFTVVVPGREKKFTMNPSGLYITYDHSSAWIHYAGEQAGESYAELEIPSDTKFLKKLARELNKFAKRLDEERS
tara:strand:+ start:235 stop:504 length:270 start_codon:yes stop_codon:yes gene_type:complete